MSSPSLGAMSVGGASSMAESAKQRRHALDAADVPQRIAAMAAQIRQGSGRGQRLHVVTIKARAAGQIVDIRECMCLARRNDFLAGNLRQSLDHAKAETKRRGRRWELRSTF